MAQDITVQSLIGQRFNLLIVVEVLGYDLNKQMKFRCLCDCGELFYRSAYGISSGHIKSCGKCNLTRTGPKRKS